MVIRDRCFLWCILLFSSCLVYGAQPDIKQQQHDNFGQMMFQRAKIAKHVVFKRDSKSAEKTAEWSDFPEELWEKVFVFFTGDWRRKGKGQYIMHAPRAIAFCHSHRIAMIYDYRKPGVGRNIYFYSLETRSRCGELVRMKTWRDWFFKGGVTSLASLPRNRIAAGSFDYPFNIEIWSTQTGELEKELSSNNNSWVSALTVVPNGDLVAGYPDGMIRMWNVDKGICVKEFQAFKDPVGPTESDLLFMQFSRRKLPQFPKKIKALAVIKDKLVINSTYFIQVRDMDTMQLYLNSYSSLYSLYAMTQCVQLWNGMIAVGHKANDIATINIFGPVGDQYIRAHSPGSKACVTSLAASPDGITLFSAGTDREIETWEYVPCVGYIVPKNQFADGALPDPEYFSDEGYKHLVQIETRRRKNMRDHHKSKHTQRFKRCLLSGVSDAYEKKLREKKSK
jgi:hypothetical protein